MSTFAPGRTIGRYRIEELLGEGGMGEVYRAHDTKLRRRVALKVIADRHRSGTEQSAARLLREAQLAASLSHPNVVTIFDVSEHDDATFIAMELLDGRSLRVARREASLPVRSWASFTATSSPTTS